MSINIFINGNHHTIAGNMNLVEALRLCGYTVPVFCYHNRLKIAGNCRMCLVQIKGMNKLTIACNTLVEDGMEILSESEAVKNARKGVLETLLINHPLDCPICDKGGECDLQDITMEYGCDYSRFDGCKRTIEDQDFGPLITTHMNRCISCGRCVRFMTDIAGSDEIGMFGRGGDTKVQILTDRIRSELSGNIIDICPVGALNSRPYAHRARSWELKHTPSIDLSDAIGSNIRIDSHNEEVMRIVPRECDDINEEWISDRARFSYDGLKHNRIERCYIGDKPSSWDNIIQASAQYLMKTNAFAIIGDTQDIASMFYLKSIMTLLDKPIYQQSIPKSLVDLNSAYYTLGSQIKGFESAHKILIIGVNPCKEAPILNIRIKRAVSNGGQVWLLGHNFDLNYPYEYLGDNLSITTDINFDCILIGYDVLIREDAQNILAKFYQASGFNVLLRKPSQIQALLMGIAAMDHSIDGAAYLFGTDTPYAFTEMLYHGHHFPSHKADIIIAGRAFTEKYGVYANAELRMQPAFKAVLPLKENRNDWRIFAAISEKIFGAPLWKNYDDLWEAVTQKYPIFKKLNVPQTSLNEYPLSSNGKILDAPIQCTYESFFQSDIISCNSMVMRHCALKE